jgi:phosphoribosylformylglycinamidine synthase
MDQWVRPDAWLFGESQSRILLSLRRRQLGRLRELAAEADVPLAVLGEVRGRRLRIGHLVDLSVTDMRDAWANALARRMSA